MPSSQNELLRKFGQGVADIEGERARKKREPGGLAKNGNPMRPPMSYMRRNPLKLKLPPG
jgi:hypothetical protein